MMAMLLRAVQEALLAGELTPGDLPGHDDSSLLALLAEPRMPQSTRDLVTALRHRQPYKVLVEISSRAGRVYSQLDALFWDQAKRRRVEIALAEELRAATDAPVTTHDVLIDVPKPEKWEMDVRVHFARPPLGMTPTMTWTEATGQRPSDLGVYEQHQRRVRIVVRDALRDALADQGYALLAHVLERVPSL
jgi:hypothetical protein